MSEGAILEAWRNEVDADLAVVAASEQGVADLTRIAQAIESLQGRTVAEGAAKDAARSTGSIPDLG
jgi:hypothetical protein